MLGPLEARLADAAKGSKDALVVADVRSLPAGKTSDRPRLGFRVLRRTAGALQPPALVARN